MKTTKTDDILDCDKSSWKEIKNGIEVWDKKKVSHFWQLIRQKIYSEKNFIFINVQFPEFEFDEGGTEQNFWNSNSTQIFEGMVTFTNCTFHEFTDFRNVSFFSNILFLSCTFKKNVQFYQCYFFEELKFQSNTFNENFNFVYSKCLNHVIFSFDKFNSQVNFQKTKFDKYLLLEHCEFSRESTFNKAHFIGEFYCKYCNFLDNVSFEGAFFDKADFIGAFFKKNIEFYGNTIFNEINFIDLKFENSTLSIDNLFSLNEEKVSRPVFVAAYFVVSLLKSEMISQSALQYNQKTIFDKENYINNLLEEESLQETLKPLRLFEKTKLFEIINGIINHSILDSCPKLKFHNVSFPNKTNFRNIDLSRTSFLESEISKITFNKCNFRQNNNRIFLYDEKESLVNFSELENLYRQLKQSFEREKHWELMDKSYVSEIKMREKQLSKSKNLILWLMFRFYGIFAGYTQDFVRPFAWYSFSTFMIFPLFYYLDFLAKNGLSNIQNISELKFDIFYYLQLSISASLPILKSDLFYNNWWLKSIQVIFSTILIAFFILAIRRKFKF